MKDELPQQNLRCLRKRRHPLLPTDDRVCENEKIEFDFHDVHDLNTALDTSQPDTIRRRLRERLANTKQTIVLGSSQCKSKASRTGSFIYYEIETLVALKLPVVLANLDGDRTARTDYLPQRFADANYHTLSVSFQPRIIQYALDDWVPGWAAVDKQGSVPVQAGDIQEAGAGLTDFHNAGYKASAVLRQAVNETVHGDRLLLRCSRSPLHRLAQCSGG